ncbi:MAG TPA: serine hydrolase domain-containing protein [Terriglobales bacterium]|jgi:CubicO group peptidase (beta-lactamase class C family)
MKPLAIVLLLLASILQAQEKPADLDARLQKAFQMLDAYAAKAVETHGIPGLSLAITDRNGILHTAAFGYADTKLKTPVTPQTRFEIGSISKSFTVISLLQLHEQGKFDPKQPITKYLPWFSVHSKYTPITGHDIMTHTAGLPRDRDDIPSSLYQAAGVRDRWTGYEPGKHYLYSNVGFQIMGYTLEEITGKSSGDNVRERILQPLGMNQTDPVFTNDTYSTLATGYSNLYDDRPNRRHAPLIEATWLEYGAGDGAIVSTASDMATYLRMLMNRGMGPNGRIMSEESFQLLTQKGVKESDDDNDYYGYGMSTWISDSHHMIGHTGGMVGYSSRLEGDMDAGYGVITLVNWAGGSDGVPDYAFKLLRAAYEGRDLTAPPQDELPGHIKNAADFAGTYTSPSGEKITMQAQGNLLLLNYHGRAISLEHYGKDQFLVPDPEFKLFPLRFGRQNGKVVEAFHGDHWFASDAYKGPRDFKTPPEWASYQGHYRSNQAWFSNFRIVLRKGELRLVSPDGEEWKMTPDGQGGFWAGDEDVPPQEQVSFDTTVHGKTLRCTLSGQGYYRVFTP